MTTTNAPTDLLIAWIDDEIKKGAPNPKQAILSTVGKDNHAHARVVAIKSISDRGIVFFTQKNTRKVDELILNPHVSLTFWFELSQRQVSIEAVAEPLSDAENREHWDQYPKLFQMRFYSYAPTSTLFIESKDDLQASFEKIQEAYKDKPLPMSEYYKGFCLRPNRYVFYTLRTDVLSDVVEYKNDKNTWKMRLLSP